MLMIFLFILAGVYLPSVQGELINVALGKPSYLNSNWDDYAAYHGVDGNINTIARSSSINGWFVVDLLMVFNIPYVIVIGTTGQRLSNFIVGLTSNYNTRRGTYELCGQWSGDAYDAGVPMRLDCRGRVKKARYVILQNSYQKIRFYVQFYELQVYAEKKLTNVALGKPAYMSSQHANDAASYGVDGKTNTMTSALNNDEWFVVDLLMEFKIQYVDVFSRKNIHYANRLSNFKVGLTSNFDKDNNKPVRRKYELCGQWSGNVYDAGVPMRLNCSGGVKKARYVILQNNERNKGDYLNFNEIEVYAKNSDVEKRYMGCYGKLSGTYSRIGHVTNVQVCYTTCALENTSFALIKSASECFCSNNLPNISSSSSQCSLKCSADDNPCGSPQLYSVYQTKVVKKANKKYLGCYKDGSNRDLPLYFENKSYNTIDLCLKICLKKGLRYFGLQFSYGCFCGQSYGRYGAGEGCSHPCPGNSSQICGGGWRNSVYEACYTYEGVLDTCSKDLHHCSGGKSPSLAGECESCEAGWKFPTCLFRNCNVNNGGCGKHKCEQYRVGEVETDECVCNERYIKKSFNDQCQSSKTKSEAIKIVLAAVEIASNVLTAASKVLKMAFET